MSSGTAESGLTDELWLDVLPEMVSPSATEDTVEQWPRGDVSVRIRPRISTAPRRFCAAKLQISVARHAGLGLALVAAWVTIAPIARAQLNLRWDAPPGCPQGSEVLERIRALAGSSLDDTAGLSAEGKIAHADGRYSLTLLVRDGSEVRQRVITSDSCADLTGAAAITLALLLGVDVGAESWAENNALQEEAPKEAAPNHGEPSAGPSDDMRRDEHDERGQRSDKSESAAAPVGPPVGRRPQTGPGRSPSPRRWAIVLRAPIGAADLGPLPGATLGVGLGVGMRYDSWRVLLAGHVFQAQTINATEPDAAFGAGADLERMTGQLVICRGWRSARFEIAPCIGLGLEHLTARGFGEGVSPETQRAIWPALSAGAIAHWYAFEYMAVFLGVTGYLELARPRLVIEGMGEIGQLAPAAAGAALGVEWIL